MKDEKGEKSEWSGIGGTEVRRPLGNYHLGRSVHSREGLGDDPGGRVVGRAVE